MSWLDKLFLKKTNKKIVFADMLAGHTPIFSQFGQDIYVSDVVQQAMHCIVSEMKKLNPVHIKTNGRDVVPVEGNLQKILDNPNPLMTKSEFIEKIMWLLLFNYNAFVIPTYDIYKEPKTNTEKRIYTALYPVAPTQVDFLQDKEQLYITLKFANQYETILPYEEVIHIRHKFSVNEFMGGNQQGQPDNQALLDTLKLNHDLLKGISHCVKSSFAINGIVKYNTLLDRGKTAAAIKEFEETIHQSKSGILPLGMEGDYIPIKNEIKLVDKDTLAFIDEKILRTWGISIAILTGDYTKAQYEAFYQKVLEPFIIAFSQSFTKTLFSQREKSFGNEVKFYPKDLIFMNTEQTLEMIRLLGDSGGLYENEKRVALGLKPLPELEGIRMQSLNYVNVNIAAQYQTKSNEGGEQNAL